MPVMFLSLDYHFVIYVKLKEKNKNLLTMQTIISQIEVSLNRDRSYDENFLFLKQFYL